MGKIPDKLIPSQLFDELKKCQKERNQWMKDAEMALKYTKQLALSNHEMRKALEGWRKWIMDQTSVSVNFLEPHLAAEKALATKCIQAEKRVANLEETARAAVWFCENLQEDHEAVDQGAMKRLHKALDKVEKHL